MLAARCGGARTVPPGDATDSTCVFSASLSSEAASASLEARLSQAVRQASAAAALTGCSAT